jgi:hypothetical protein
MISIVFRSVINLSWFCLGAMLLVGGCNNEDPVPANEEELITTLTLTFQKVDDLGTPLNAPVSFTWEDLDGSGSAAPVIDDVTLDANSNYQVTLELIDKSKTPKLDVGAEVEEEGDEHQFFFVGASTLQLSFQYDDLDVNGNPIGLKAMATSQSASSGTLSVILRHEPLKDAAGVFKGDITNAEGETDLDATFNVSIL